MKRRYVLYPYHISEYLILKNPNKYRNARQVFEIFIFFKKISVNIKTIGKRAGMIADRRVTKLFRVVNEVMIGREKQKK